MNELDEYDTLIAKRLPCDCGDRGGRGGHFSSCAAYWRADVVELLRERGAEIERLRAEWNRQFTRNAELIVEHDALRAEIERLKRGEYICAKCGLRKDGEGERGEF